MTRPRRPERERGSAEAEAAISLTACFLLLTLVVHIALWAHAQHRAQAIAEQVLAATRAADATTATGQRRADAVTVSLGGDLLREITVDITRTPATAHVTVEASIQGLVPGWNPEVRAALTAPVEPLGQADP